MKALLLMRINPLFCLLIILLVTVSDVFSQSKNVIVIKSGEQISSAQMHFFRYPEFKVGKVYFDNSDSAKNMLNYNFVLGALQFISTNGDTLAIANETEVKRVVIEADTFLIINGQYLEVVKTYPFGKLLVGQKMKLSDEHRAGAYGIKSATHQIEAKNSLIADQNHRLVLDRDLILTKETQYYFLRNSNKAQPVTKKNILQAFSRDKQAIEDFIVLHNTNFNKEADLTGLFAFLATL